MKLTKPKYIFVTGGVASSLGKGIISSSLARLSRRFRNLTPISMSIPERSTPTSMVSAM